MKSSEITLAPAVLVLAFGLFAVACEQTEPTTPLADGMTPPEHLSLIKFGNGPESPGFWVERNEVPSIGLRAFFEHKNGEPLDPPLMIAIGLGSEDPAESAVCGGDVEPELVSLQHVVLPDRLIDLELRLGNTAHAYDFFAFMDTWFEGDGFCSALSLPLQASGTVHTAIYNDNDLFVETSNNVYGSRFNISLSDAASGRHLTAHSHGKFQIRVKGGESQVRVLTNQAWIQ